jgi:hypothetical protein
MALGGIPRYLGHRNEALKFENESLSRLEERKVNRAN